MRVRSVQVRVLCGAPSMVCMGIEEVSRQSLFPAIYRPKYGVVAQLGERVPCKHQVEGSIPSDSTRLGNPRRNKDLFRSY